MKSLIVILTILMLVTTAQAQYGGGTGELNDPYQIVTAEDLLLLGKTPEDYGKHFILTADIYLGIYNGTDFNMIGGSGIPFTGVFDGNGHTISNFSYTSTQTARIGLFGFIDDPNAQIINLGLINPNIDAGTGDSVGSLVGCLKAGRIVGCYVEDGSVSGDFSVGGLVGKTGGTIINSYSTSNISGNGTIGGLIGRNFGRIDGCYSTGNVSGEDLVGALVGNNTCTITNCFSTGSVLGNNYVGGLIGKNSGTIDGCYSIGNVSGEDQVGGLVGQNGYTFYDSGWNARVYYDGTISKCYSTSSISGYEFVGGLVGLNDVGIITNCYATSSATADHSVGGLVGYNWDRISNCYSLGSVLGTNDVGGLVGFNQVGGSVTFSFWNTETSGLSTSAGGTGKTTAEMQNATTFLEAGWGFVDETANGTEDSWFMPEGDYPRLWWQYGRVFSPYPQDGAADVPQPLILSWLPGRSGLQHDIYFGEDREAVANATTESPNIYRGRQEPEITTYDPGNLELEKTYYWRIDETNQADPNSSWNGNIWSFTTANFIVVDDFESYSAENPISMHWNGWPNYDPWPPDYTPFVAGNGTGAVVGSGTTASGCEEIIVHGGRQSMPFSYDNDKQGYSKYSETEKLLDYPRDWTEEGLVELSLWFIGILSNDAEPLYVAVSNAAGMPAVAIHPDPAAAQTTTWTEWVIPLQTFADQGINLTNVDRIAIGFGTRGNMTIHGGSGKMYFDNIRLYRSQPEPETETSGEFSNDVIYANIKIK